MKFSAAASVLFALASPAHADFLKLLRGSSGAGRRELEETAPSRGLRVRVFQDVQHIMWDKHQGADANLVPRRLKNWIVSVDGTDIGSTDPTTGLLTYEAASADALQGGASVCVRPGSAAAAGEAACGVAKTECAQTKWSISQKGFPYRSEVEKNPNGAGVVWYDGPLSASGTDAIFSKVYVKDYCYTLKESDFIERALLEEAWVRFSLVKAAPAPTPTPTAAPTNSVAPSATPSDVPSAAPSESVAPSAVPTVSHAPSVSSAPSAYPTVSHAPSVSVAPSATPSDVPSAAPSVSVAPSATPSDVPSAAPSVSVAPSAVPSDAPSATPSAAPSDAPSVAPSGQPSAAPVAGR